MSQIIIESYKIISNVLKKNKFSTKLLDQSRKRLQKRNENTDLLYTLVKGTIKMYKHLEFIASQHTEQEKYQKTDLKLKVMIYLGLYQLKFLDSIPDHAVINETVEAAKKLFGSKVGNFVNGVLRSYQRNQQIEYPENLIQRLSVEYSFEEEMIREFVKLYGEEDTEYACLYFNETPKLRVRVNLLATDRKKFISYFQRRSIEFTPCAASENFCETDSGDKALNDVAFSEGYFSIQDTAAGLVVELMSPELGMSVMDMFAAPGGKACYTAELLQDNGEVIAIDKIPGKCKLIKQNAERLRIRCLRVITEDAFNYGPVAAAYDKVLLDVPCSGWGVMQKKAELRWQHKQDIPQLIKLQEQALKRGAQFVTPGGDLIYSTCTLNPKENEEQVNKFLVKNPDFELVRAETIIPGEYTENGFLKTIPWRHNIDGAFAARLRRKT